MHDFSVRGGFADPEGEGDVRILLGGDFRTPVFTHSEKFPLDGAFTAGFGANVGDGDDVGYLPIGISLGRGFKLQDSKTTFVPYAHPVLVPVFGAEDDDFGFALGLGVDINFGSNFAVQVSGGLGDLEGVGVSLAYVR